MDNKKLDYEKINHLVELATKILKVLFYIIVILGIFVFTSLIKELKVYQLFSMILSVISPLIIGVAIAWLFDPVVTYLQKKSISRIIGTTIVYIMIILFFTIFYNLVFPMLYEQINDLVRSGPRILGKSSNWIDDFLRVVAVKYNLDFTALHGKTYEAINSIFMSGQLDISANIIRFVKSFITGGAKFLVSLFIGFYVLLDFDDVKRHFAKLVSKKHKEDVKELTGLLNSSLRQYVKSALLVLLILFFFQSLGFYLSGLSAPLAFGLFCALTNMIPYIGPFIGGIPAVIVGLTMSFEIGLKALIAVVICQLIESKFLTPNIMSKTMKLHPVTIIVSLMIMGKFFGIVGMIFATPIVASINIIYKFLKKNNFYGVFNIVEKN